MGAVAVKDGIYETIVDNAPEGAVELFHGYTYSAHPAACAAGLATLDIYEREKLFDRAAAMSERFLDGMFALADLPAVTEIATRGSRRRLSGFSRPSAVLKTTSPSTSSIQTGDTCGEPSAIRVATCAKVLPLSMCFASAGISAISLLC